MPGQHVKIKLRRNTQMTWIRQDRVDQPRMIEQRISRLGVAEKIDKRNAMTCSASRALAINLNLPYGTLNPNFSVTTRLGTFPNLIRNSPRPVLPPGTLPRHFRGSGVFILDLNTVRGTVGAVRILHSTGN